MQISLLQVLTGLAIAGFSDAYPSDDLSLQNEVGRRALTPDNTCGTLGAGNGKNYICDPSSTQGGGCCSSSGYCGTTEAYCGAGCQTAFGTCSGSDSTPTGPNLCGPLNGNNRCLSALCCSQAGYCGNTTDYCAAGCQSGFGDCIAGAGNGGDGTCGPAFGNKQCPSGQCCSASGYCGTTEDYCQDPSCQYGFGKCDSDTTPSGASTLNDPRPLLGAVSYDDDIYNCVKNNVVALTYDDGPYLYTSELLDLLKSYGFKATFFITGNNLGKGAIDTTPLYSNIVKRMIAEGHQVASHTWSHYSLSNISSDQRKQQMVKNERAIANIIGKYPTYMRPPFSQCDAASGCQADMKSLGYHRISFDLDTQDYLNPLPTQIQNSKDIVRSILATAGSSDYLSIQHDIVQQSVANLTGYYFGLIQAKGRKGVTAGECLNDPEANWYRVPGGGAAPARPTTSITTSTSQTQPSASSLTSITSQTTSTTSRASSTPSTPSKTTSTPTTSITVPTAKPTCAVKAGNFCGTIDSFGDKMGCQKSSASCYQQSSNCLAQAGRSNRGACNTYKADCQRLTQYCSKCGFVCSSTAFNSGSSGKRRWRGRN